MTERFDHLMADLSGELDAGLAAELAAEVEDRTRYEVGRLRLVDRLRAAVGARLAIGTSGGPVDGVLNTVGADWVRVAERPGCSVVVPLAAIRWVRGLGPTSAPPVHDAVADRLDLRFALRRLARDRAVVRVRLVDDDEAAGVIGRVAADYFEVTGPVTADRPTGGAQVVPLAGVAWVRWG